MRTIEIVMIVISYIVTIRSLARARASEQLLRNERDQLERLVEERTKEVKAIQHEKIAQLYRFAEFGRLSAGVFHDLMNSLHTVVLHVSNLQSSDESIPEVQQQLEKAVISSKRMGHYIATVRKQMDSSTALSRFSPQKEITDAIDILRFKSREASVHIRYTTKTPIILYGNALRFYQVMTNLIGNAIEACEENTRQSFVTVSVAAAKKHHTLVIKITDNGAGIASEAIPLVFKPFFTTKPYQKGIGLGLSQSKEIIEQDFNGTIAVSSNKKRTTFTVLIPI